MAALVHVVEDDDDLRRLLVQGLCEEGFEVVGSEGAETALRQHGERPADVFVIDIGLEDADGRDLCQALRAQGVGAPVLFLTALDATPDRISGFRAGGDDYVTKPFAFSELVARLHALLRRADADALGESGILQLDPTRRTVACGGRERRAEPRPSTGSWVRSRVDRARRCAASRSSAPPGPRARSSARTRSTPTSRACGASCANCLGPGDRDRARRRLRASMRARRPRGIRARLLTTNAVVMLLALVVLTGGSNAILRRSLDRDATNLVHARAAAGLATLRRLGGSGSRWSSRPTTRPSTSRSGSSTSTGRSRTLRPRRRSSTAGRGARGRAADDRSTSADTRLHAVPVVRDGKRVGTLVAGVGLRAYQPDGAHRADRLDRARGASVRVSSCSHPARSCDVRSSRCRR